MQLNHFLSPLCVIMYNTTRGKDGAFREMGH